LKQLVQLEGMIGDDVLKRFAFEILHNDEGATGGFADVVDGTDIGMIQGRSSFSFAPEAFQRMRIVG